MSQQGGAEGNGPARGFPGQPRRALRLTVQKHESRDVAGEEIVARRRQPRAATGVELGTWLGPWREAMQGQGRGSGIPAGSWLEHLLSNPQNTATRRGELPDVRLDRGLDPVRHPGRARRGKADYVAAKQQKAWRQRGASTLRPSQQRHQLGAGRMRQSTHQAQPTDRCRWSEGPNDTTTAGPSRHGRARTTRKSSVGVGAVSPPPSSTVWSALSSWPRTSMCKRSPPR